MHSKRGVHSLLFLALLMTGVMVSGLLIPSSAMAQFSCGPSAGCSTDQDCLNPGPNENQCPNCFVCDTSGGTPGQCVPNDALCDDGTSCTSGICNGTDIEEDLGCLYTPLVIAFPPDLSLPIDCYLCSPTANGVSVNNGICEPAAGETCENSVDCQTTPGFPCITPPTPPTCDNLDSGVRCDDNDRCTANLCETTTGTTVVFFCENPPKTCDFRGTDGCCPAGCVGPDPSGVLPCQDAQGEFIPNCDPDCWFSPQVCGDTHVQAPETCDDSANGENAGISPQGTVVTDEQCRNAGEVAECTYCGDGLIQTEAGEQCDYNQIGTCGAEGCNLTTCQCNQETLCVSGSGQIWDTVRDGCGGCSLNQGMENPQDLKNYLILFLVPVALGLIWRRRLS